MSSELKQKLDTLELVSKEDSFKAEEVKKDIINYFQEKINKLNVVCGKTTCSYDYGKFCSFVSTTKMGTKFHCILFGIELQDDKPNGSLQRCDECLNTYE